MYKTLHKKQGSVTVQLRFARSSVTFCAKRDKMIERQKAKYGWEFLFLGANIDAVETASQFGIGADRAVNYQCDSEGTALNYEVVSEAISSVRCSAPLNADWKKRIDEDYKKRGGK